MPVKARWPAIGLVLPAAAVSSVEFGALKVYAANGTSVKAPPLTEIFTLPPSTLNSLAIEWSNVSRGAFCFAPGSSTAGLVIESTLDASPAPLLHTPARVAGQ